MDGDMNQGGAKKGMKFATWNSWSSWSSPVGLGIFLFLGAIASAIAFYALISLASAAVALSHPQPAMPTYSAQDMQQLETQGAGTGALMHAGAQ